MNDFKQRFNELGLDERKNYLVDFSFTEIRGAVAIERSLENRRMFSPGDDFNTPLSSSISETIKPFVRFGFRTEAGNFYYNIAHGRNIDLLVKTPLDVLETEKAGLQLKAYKLEQQNRDLQARLHDLAVDYGLLRLLPLFDRIMFLFEGKHWIDVIDKKLKADLKKDW